MQLQMAASFSHYAGSSQSSLHVGHSLLAIYLASAFTAYVFKLG